MLRLKAFPSADALSGESELRSYETLMKREQKHRYLFSKQAQSLALRSVTSFRLSVSSKLVPARVECRLASNAFQLIHSADILLASSRAPAWRTWGIYSGGIRLK